MTKLYDTPTVPDLALRAMERWGDRVAFDGNGGTFTYRQCAALIGRMQAAMVKLGLRHGQAIAVLHGNRGDAWLAGIAATALGLRLTPLHPLGSLEDQAFILEDAGIDYLLVDNGPAAARAAELAERWDGLSQILTLGPADIGVDILAAAENAGSANAAVHVTGDDLAWVTFTGGTTGRPKAAYRHHRSYAAISQAVGASFEFPETPRYLAVAPNSHVGGTKILPTLIKGGSVHCINGFDPGRVLQTIEQERISTTLLVPTMIYGLLDHPDLDQTDLSSLELLMYGASPMSPTRLIEGLERVGPVFSQLYGQTEGYPISVLRRGEHDLADQDLFASCGYPCASVQVALLDDECNSVADGEVGEICVRAPHVMAGYWNREPETEESFKGGWLHTGDMACADERGFLFIVDRKKDMIITGGFNVYPREIEDVLTGQPGVSMAAVIGVPDPKWGEAVKAFIVSRGTRPEAAALIAAVRDSKGAAHAPKSIEFVDEIPVTSIGKPDKKALRAMFWNSSERQVG